MNKVLFCNAVHRLKIKVKDDSIISKCMLLQKIEEKL